VVKQVLGYLKVLQYKYYNEHIFIIMHN